MGVFFIPEQEERYIELLLAEVDPETKKHALQRLCKLLRAGGRLRNPHSFRQTLNGQLHNSSVKVRRWALNALALTGRSNENLQAVLDAMRRDRANPDIVASGVAALFGLCKPDEVSKLLEDQHLPLEGAVLIASAQHSVSHRKLLASRRINIENASSVELRLATILIGVGKAPENLFVPAHTNKAVIGILNSHDDPIVAQYSVWAIAENEAMDLGDLRLRLKDIESFPTNVRTWVYRLIASDAGTAAANLQYLVAGSRDTEAPVREGLAAGLRNLFFDGIEEVVFDWLPNEPGEAIRQRLLEHMAAFAERCASYTLPVKSAYGDAGRSSLTRVRLEAAAQGTSLYASLRRLAMEAEQATLFGSVDRDNERPITMVTQNISGNNVTIGALTGEGRISSHTVRAVNDVHGEGGDVLKLVLEFMGRQIASPEVKHEGEQLVEAAATQPNQSTVSKLLGWLKSIQTGTALAASTSQGIEQVVETVSGWLQHLPN